MFVGVVTRSSRLIKEHTRASHSRKAAKQAVSEESKLASASPSEVPKCSRAGANKFKGKEGKKLGIASLQDDNLTDKCNGSQWSGEDGMR